MITTPALTGRDEFDCSRTLHDFAVMERFSDCTTHAVSQSCGSPPIGDGKTSEDHQTACPNRPTLTFDDGSNLAIRKLRGATSTGSCVTCLTCLAISHNFLRINDWSGHVGEGTLRGSSRFTNV
jgi:hypothetical protein